MSCLADIVVAQNFQLYIVAANSLCYMSCVYHRLIYHISARRIEIFDARTVANNARCVLCSGGDGMAGDGVAMTCAEEHRVKALT